jgi:1-acyl-sn-glycerol-3-phosphate acyltransferase
MNADSRAPFVKPSRRLMGLFQFYLRWYVGRHFHGLRLANGGRFPTSVEGPTIIYLNHPSWWDPLTCILISRHFLPHADHYAPMDEAALARYKFFAKLGLFPVEMNTGRGALQFIRSSTEIVSTPNSVLWLTPQGNFADPRKQPLVFKDGLASLLSRLPRATLLPLALEYVYWDERLPEILVNCGDPIHITDGDKYDRSSLNNTLTAALNATQQDLAALGITRDAARFESLIEGGAGIGVMYDLWQRMRSGISGQPYRPEHGSIHRP